jgi:hypothetical protein
VSIKGITPVAPRPPQPPAAPRGMGRRKKASAVTDVAVRPTGRRFLKLGQLPQTRPDWCVPPPEFVGAHTSLPEFMIYAALFMVTGDKGNPRKPPFTGGLHFTYQDPLLGGRQTRGGQVCDFSVRWGSEDICIRLQSDFWHLQADNAKRADEAFEKTHAAMRIVDIFEQEFVTDCSLRAACAVVANALAGRESPNPASLGTTQQKRRRGGDR